MSETIKTAAERRELLIRWTQAQLDLLKVKPLLEAEMELRKAVAVEFFPTPVEGTNTEKLEEGWELKLTHKIDRKIDEAALPVVRERLRAMNVNPDPLVKYKPELDTKAYKSLLQINHEASQIFDLAMTSKPASPTLELKPPKAPK